jgi:hypothetical protein
LQQWDRATAVQSLFLSRALHQSRL